MKTVYVDIYFLINFCVDIFALGLALYILKIKCGIKRLIFAAAIGAMYAVFGIIFSDRRYIMPILTVPIFLVMIVTVTKGVSLVRKIKYAIAFLLSEIIIGGFVYYGFCLLDIVMERFNIDSGEVENKNLLTWSVIVLLSYGIVKIMMYFLGNASSIRSVRLCVGYEGREESFEALVDTGNLVEDPAGKRPVVFITEELAWKIIGKKIDFSGDITQSCDEFKKRIRLIPVNSGEEKRMLLGFLSDYVTVVNMGKYENINVSFAVDKKGELYGGYPALMPAVAIDNVF
ncbi:MAG: sigma-E processing peptidase SpoIIGA [Clostridia bacterium]|nr:sigma-E processing peptidase SpoIIGA [Clostridia bacterium]